MSLLWETTRNIENSLIDFIQSKVTSENLKLIDENGTEVAPNIYRGKQLSDNWNLPLIQIYIDDKNITRGEIGSNLRFKFYLIIVEIRTLFPGQEVDLADWIEEQLNDGCTYYTYTANLANPDSPTKTLGGRVNIDFQSSRPVIVGDNVDKFDKYRYRLVLKTWIN